MVEAWSGSIQPVSIVEVTIESLVYIGKPVRFVPPAFALKNISKIPVSKMP